jgi:hypothetical protein
MIVMIRMKVTMADVKKNWPRKPKNIIAILAIVNAPENKHMKRT